MGFRGILKAAAAPFVADFWNGRLYTIESAAPRGSFAADVRLDEIEDVGAIARSQFEEIRSQAERREPDMFAFGAWAGSELVAVCWFQSRETHRRRGEWFRLRDDEAELAQISTAMRFRGRGIASELIRFGADSMRAKGYTRLCAKIWHDNVSSRRAFERAGWREERRFIGIRLRRWSRPLLFQVRR